MTNDNINKSYDLEERTAKFGSEIVSICKKITLNTVTVPIIDQLVRSGTSVGANYCEANGASSRKDFKNKIFICKKEAKETAYWLRIFGNAIMDEEQKIKLRGLWQEATELSKIFAKIALSTN